MTRKKASYNSGSNPIQGHIFCPDTQTGSRDIPSSLRLSITKTSSLGPVLVGQSAIEPFCCWFSVCIKWPPTQTYKQNYRKIKIVTQLLPPWSTTVHCLHTHITLPLSVLNTQSAVRYRKALRRYKLSLPETSLQLCSTWLEKWHKWRSSDTKSHTITTKLNLLKLYINIHGLQYNCF